MIPNTYCLIYQLLEMTDNNSGISAKSTFTMIFNPGPNLDLVYIWQSDAAPFCENYAKL